jgi:tripeptidyl-peptidase-1
MVALCVFSIVAVISTVLGNPVVSPRSSYSIRERHVVPKGWTRTGPAPANAIVNLRIALKQSRFDELERHLLEGMLQILQIVQDCTTPKATKRWI